jgi:choice-of-anchor B domain-containing protein
MKTAMFAALAASSLAALHSNETIWTPAIGQELCGDNCRDLAVDHHKMNRVMPLINAQNKKCHKEGTCGPSYIEDLKSSSSEKCENGMAGEYPCDGIDLMSFVSMKDLGGNDEGNDIWGWEDPDSGKEWAIICLTDGTSFVDISDPTKPVVFAFLPTQTSSSTWRDVKVHNNHAYVVSEARNHGMQVVDLKKIAAMTPGATPTRIVADAVYTEVGNTHNIVINEDTGFAYLVGTQTCSGGLHMVDLADPLKPKYSGCYSKGGYSHDAECVVYKGPDTKYTGKEICFGYNEDKLEIVDVTNKATPITISSTTYDDAQYTHQGWLNTDQSFLLMNDELDELYGNQDGRTRTLMWDVSDLSRPVNTANFRHETKAIDHNLYLKGDMAYLANYCDGLVIMDVSQIKDSKIDRAAHFDIAPYCSTASNVDPVFGGAWSNYPYYKSGVIAVSSIERGLFILKATDAVVAGVEANAADFKARFNTTRL